MSVAADVVRGVLCVGVLAGLAVVARYALVLVLGWWELVEPGFAAMVDGVRFVAELVRRLLGLVVIGVGMRIIRLGDWIALVPREVIHE